MRRLDLDDELVLFEGPWTADGRQLVADAVRAFEARHPHLPAPRFNERPWVAVRHNVDAAPFLFATRVGTLHTFSGTAAEELSRAILHDLMKQKTDPSLSAPDDPAR